LRNTNNGAPGEDQQYYTHDGAFGGELPPIQGSIENAAAAVA
jgi:hypothetical protein